MGVLVFELLNSSMQFLGVPVYTYIVQGVVIVFAVALDIRKYIEKKQSGDGLLFCVWKRLSYDVEAL